jgi:hypothetical protein
MQSCKFHEAKGRAMKIGKEEIAADKIRRK